MSQNNSFKRNIEKQLKCVNQGNMFCSRRLKKPFVGCLVSDGLPVYSEPARVTGTCVKIARNGQHCSASDKGAACSQQPIRVPIHVSVALLPIQLPTDDLGKQHTLAQVCGPLCPRGKPDEAPGFCLCLVQHDLGCCGHLGSEGADGRAVYLSLFFVTMSFKINRSQKRRRNCI